MIPAKVRLSYEQARRSGTGSTFAKCLLDLLDIHFAIDERDLRRVPAAGPAMIAANHPYGIVEGLILAAILDRIRPDWYILANSVLSAICELREHLILVNPFETREAVSENVSPLRRAMKGLARGHLISMFPAGEVAHPSWRDLAVTDPAWKETCARLALKARCCVVPLFFEGCNSASFHLAGVLHPGLRTVGLAHEFSKLAGKTVQLRVGNAIAPSVLAGYPNARQATEYLRARTYFLGHRCEAQRAAPSMLPVSRYVPARGDVLARRIASLPATCEVAANRDFAVYASQADGIPEILDEIGRCREVAFRQAGEGTGADRDLDRFDRYYLHLFLWSKADSCIAGAYRLAVTTDVLREHGLSGLYTNTLFRF
ncbi:MAG TPA: lysophospholipid acyltransferase family protein, partial [Bryobacteraceae bacterium]|nr:lysophospholipid acyltransferase family protein [Bryobacteraceae bacterium]